MGKPPEALRDGSVELRRTDPADADALFEAVSASMKELHRWQPWATPDYGRDHAKDFACRSWLGWREGTRYDFLVRQVGSERVLGTVGLNGIRNGQANLGYWTRTAATGQGLATTATRLCARFAFEHVGLRRVHLHHHVDNHGSRRVAEKAGFVREGVHRQVTVLHGTPIDAVFYSLLGPDEIH